ncbi:hypothetical protein evm_010351 [Chilo suppressalis]|nr:hypothetical protein evm_010351 [Chilo suppressalis]
MTAISSHRDIIKMRVLILSAAIFACASCAPSGLVAAPLAAVAPAVAVAPAIPLAPVNSGDLQAALIDSKVQTEDFLRAVADKNREVVEQVVEVNNDKVNENNDLVKERSLEAFWAEEEKKWQALDALKTAEAQIDGQIASASDKTAKSLVAPAVVAPISPVVAPISPYFYSTQVLTPGLNSVSTSFVQISGSPEAAKLEEKKEEVKSAEKPEEIKNDSVQIESADSKAAEVKSDVKSEEVKEEGKYVVGQTPLVTPLALTTLKVASPWVSAPIGLIQNDLRLAVPYAAGQLYAPAVIKTVW